LRKTEEPTAMSEASFKKNVGQPQLYTVTDLLGGGRSRARGRGREGLENNVGVALGAVAEKMTVHLRSQQQQVKNDDHQLKLNIFVNQSMTLLTSGKSNVAFATVLLEGI